MKLARGIVSILMFMLLLSFMSIPVFAIQTQSSSGRTDTSSEQSNAGSRQKASETMESSSKETASVQSDNSALQNSSVSQSSEILLPEVSVDSEAAGIISKGTNVTPSNTTQTWLGIAFWICIAIGILIIVVVIVAATRKPPKGGTGKKRYERRPMTPKGKRILNEKYYRNIKK